MALDLILTGREVINTDQTFEGRSLHAVEVNLARMRNDDHQILAEFIAQHFDASRHAGRVAEEQRHYFLSSDDIRAIIHEMKESEAFTNRKDEYCAFWTKALDWLG